MSSSLPAVVFQYLAWLVAGPATAAVLCWAMVAKPAAATGPPVQALVWLLAGIACGELLAGQQKHPTRILGFVPYGASGLVMAFALRAVFVSAPAWLCVWLGVMCGII